MTIAAQPTADHGTNLIYLILLGGIALAMLWGLVKR